MSIALLWIVSILYAGAAAFALAEGRPQFAVTLAGYVIANLGLIWAMQSIMTLSRQCLFIACIISFMQIVAMIARHWL